MTVCISAICEHNLILGASDRMLTDTGGNIEFESSPASTGNDFPFKITPINTALSIVIMMAGAMDIQAQIVLRMIRLIES